MCMYINTYKFAYNYETNEIRFGELFWEKACLYE